ncbi:putative transcription factor C2H2 family [Dioscorea sansibarensis]
MTTIPSRPIPMHLLLLLLLAAGAAGQSGANSSDPTRYNTNFNPSMAIIIVVLISAFFFLGFFSIYIRQCGGGGLGSIAGVAPATGGLSRRGNAQRGLDPEVLLTFPTFVYSEVKDLKVGKGSLECAVCLSEFEDDESLRLLPKCDHVFHSDCIDAWLAAHATCPVCRSNLIPGSDPEPSDAPATAAATTAATAAPEAPPEHVAIAVDGDGDQESDDHQEELAELARIGSQRRAAQALKSKSVARPVRFPRSHSTGHSILRRPGENLDRFTLRLPEHVRREMVVAGLQRTASSLAFPGGGEASARRGYRAGEGSSRGGRSIRLGRSDRWPSVLARTLSARFTSWGNGRRAGDGEGSVKKGDAEGSRSGSVKLRMPSVRV